jgi:hypothetical protein
VVFLGIHNEDVMPNANPMQSRPFSLIWSLLSRTIDRSIDRSIV